MLNKKLLYFLFYFLLANTTSFSQSVQDLQKMKKEYEKFKSGQLALPLPNQSNIPGESFNSSGIYSKRSSIGFNQNNNNNDSLNNEIQRFGYDFFTRRDSIAFWENLPTPKNYLLGPGDELILSLWGETQLRQSYIISREGTIYDDKIGLLIMTGRTIEEGEKFLKSSFSKVYSTLRVENATTFIDLSLGKLRSINVNFVGEVIMPGVYPIHPFSTIITGLIQAGGVDTTGSLRKIIIRRNNKTINFDMYDYLLNGKLDGDIQLRDQDIVVIPPLQLTITIDSAVFRPAKYEFIEGESIMQLLKYAGGLNADASSVLSLERIVPIKNRKNNESIYKYKNIDYSTLNTIFAQNGDHLTATSIKTVNSKVEIYGISDNPYSFGFYDGMTLNDLFDISGIFIQDNFFTLNQYLDKAEISRKDSKNGYEKIITFDLHDLLSNTIKAKLIKLNNHDRIMIYKNKNFKNRETIKISGEVNRPGTFSLTGPQESLASLLVRAEGLTKNALEDGVSVHRQKKYYDKLYIKKNIADFDLQNENSRLNYIKDQAKSENKVFQGDDQRIRLAWHNKNLNLMPGDSVHVREKTNTVNVLGEVYNPGLKEYQKGKSLRYYINSAGGLTERGSYDKIIVIYANGVTKPKKWYLNPKIKDGATIIINQNEKSVPFNITEFATNWTSILSSLVTAVILSQQISSQ